MLQRAPQGWSNWVGNQSFEPQRMVAAADEAAAIAAVRDAVAKGQGVRAPGTGHSFTPIVETSGTLLSIDALTGLIAVDAETRHVTAWAQTAIGAFGEPLWEQGLALANQGDIDTQAIAGAIATGTHGSGATLGSFSSALVAARMINGKGEVRDLSLADHPDIFPAVQTSIGMLGLMTRVTIKVVPAYRLHEQIRIMHVDEVLERWDELIASYRHFSFFWMPTDESAALYGFEGASADHCMVKLYNEAPPDFQPIEPGDRADRSYSIYPHVFEPNFHEMEYFMPAQQGREVFAAQRKFMLGALPDSRFPLEVRFVAKDEAWLSPNYKRGSIVLSISGTPGTDYWSYLRATDALFAEFEARPHWGKLHFMTPARMETLFPRYGDFRKLRREFDPNGTFLNPHLRELFE
jgi:FAD/FMN-containing dehydrogenase